jgi:hypothetical protein
MANFISLSSASSDPSFENWYTNIYRPSFAGQRGALLAPRLLTSRVLPSVTEAFGKYKASLPDSPQSIQKNMESQGLVYDSPFFPRGFNLQQFMIGRSANSGSNSGLGEKSYAGGRFNFRSS